MYLDFYGLKRRPFDMTPDPLFFFPSQKHTEALASLTYTLTERRGFVVITGEIGSGKTTVCRTLLNKLDPAARVAMLTNTSLTPKQLLEAISDQFGLPMENRTKVALLTGLHRFLMEQNDAGNPVVLIMDEAQNLSVKALEEMRLISNMETDAEKLVQIVMLGQPELRDKLNRPELEQLRQRICLRYHLRSLNKKEIGPYIEHRLRIAGNDGQVKFTKRALDSLYSFSKGIPRLINVVCDQALLTGYLRETRKLDKAIIEEIAAEFRSPAEEEAGEDIEVMGEKPPPFRFWRLFRRKRERGTPKREAAEVLPSPDSLSLTAEEEEGAGPQGEPDILSRLTELRLTGIFPENGTFVATIDGVHLKAEDRLFGMKVARVDEDKIVFLFGDKRYQLTIESRADAQGAGTASPGRDATTAEQSEVLDT